MWIAPPGTLGANHAGTVDHHDLWDLETLRRCPTQIAVHPVRRRVAYGIRHVEEPRKRRDGEPADSVVEGYPIRLEAERAQLTVKLVDRRRHAHAVRAIGQQELDQHHFALGAREQALLARRSEELQFRRLTWDRRRSDRERRGKRHED